MKPDKVIITQENGKYKFTCNFKSLNDSQGFIMSSSNYNEVVEFVNDLLSIFADNDEYGNRVKRLKLLQFNTLNIKNDFILLSEKYEKNLPQIKGLISFFKKTGDNKAFVIILNEPITPKLSFDLNAYLYSLSGNRSFEEIKEENDKLFKNVIEEYHIRAVGEFRKSIGNPIKTERLCRFCKKKVPEVSFKYKAHAMSEALGNKNVILFDECDKCNEVFGKSIEGDIITYLSLFRTIYEVDGKRGKKKIKGRNFEMTKNETVEIKFWNIDERPKKGDPYNLRLDFGKDLNRQNIYKTLCKFFLSVIEEDQLHYFEKTFDWINGKYISTNKLPKVAELISYEHFSKQPKIFYYLRKSNKTKLPYAICDFQFTCKKMVFIIPFCSLDKQEFNSSKDWDKIFKVFKYFDETRGWQFNDFSKDKNENLIVQLNSKLHIENKTNGK